MGGLAFCFLGIKGAEREALWKSWKEVNNEIFNDRFSNRFKCEYGWGILQKATAKTLSFVWVWSEKFWGTVQFVDDAEMAEIHADENLLVRLKQGSKEAKARKGRFVE